MYEKLAGMTGTALTEADELMDIYGLEVVEVPTNMAVARTDEDDEVYRTAAEKYRAIIDAAQGVQGQGPAGAGRHHLDREVRDPGRAPEEGRLHPEGLLRPHRVRRPVRRGAQGARQGVRGAQRPLPRAGGADRLPGRRAGRHHHRHQHGRPRHRHPARRQPRHAHQGRAGRTWSPARSTTAAPRPSAPSAPASRKRRSRPAACSCSAPSATRAGASTTSCAAAPAARAIPAARASSCRWKTI